MTKEKEELEKRVNSLKKDYEDVCNSPEGIRVLRHIFLMCGYSKSILSQYFDVHIYFIIS